MRSSSEMGRPPLSRLPKNSSVKGRAGSCVKQAPCLEKGDEAFLLAHVQDK